MTSVTTPGAQSLLIQVYNACCWAWKVCHASDDGKHPLEKQKFFPTEDAHKRRENSVCIFAGNIAGGSVRFGVPRIRVNNAKEDATEAEVANL